ncbi:hypothetical protein EAZG_04518 [Escherichia coli TA249]|nr:hypothetical protein EAZG_04518 [Escherichia coli TA249]
MTLFDECREALSADFNIVEGLAQQEVLGILNKYPLAKGSVTWSEIRHSDYESFDELLSANSVKTMTCLSLQMMQVFQFLGQI